MGWFQHVVLPMLRPPGQIGAALADGAGGHVGMHCASPRRAYAGRCFAGAEGVGCPLSPAEQHIAARVADEPMSWEVC